MFSLGNVLFECESSVEFCLYLRHIVQFFSDQNAQRTIKNLIQIASHSDKFCVVNFKEFSSVNNLINSNSLAKQHFFLTDSNISECDTYRDPFSHHKVCHKHSTIHSFPDFNKYGCPTISSSHSSKSSTLSI